MIFEIAVIGLGGIGSGAAYWASRRSDGSVLGLEQFDLGHGRGASDDHSRIIRYSYHRRDYVELARAAFATWRVVAEEAGERLVVTTGGLDFFPAGAAIAEGDYTGALRAAGIDHDVVEADEAMARWPQFSLPDGCRVLYQADGGLVRAQAANEAHRRLAIQRGADLRPNCRVTGIDASGAVIEIDTTAGRFQARRLVIAADAWTNGVLSHFGDRINLLVTREEVAYFAPRSQVPMYGTDLMPVWIWEDDPGFYGLPSLDRTGVKIGGDVGGPAVDPNTRNFDPDPRYQSRLRRFIEGLVPGGAGELIEAKTCLYTLPPDREFVLGHVLGEPRAALALGAAHGFKFASVIGRSLVELVYDGQASVGIDGFSIEREVLRMDDPPARYLV